MVSSGFETKSIAPPMPFTSLFGIIKLAFDGAGKNKYRFGTSVSLVLMSVEIVGDDAHEIAVGADLHGPEDGHVYMSTAYHRKAFDAVKDRRSREESHRLFPGVDDIATTRRHHIEIKRSSAQVGDVRERSGRSLRVDLVWGRVRTHAKDSVFRL